MGASCETSDQLRVPVALQVRAMLSLVEQREAGPVGPQVRGIWSSRFSGLSSRLHHRPESQVPFCSYQDLVLSTGDLPVTALISL